VAARVSETYVLRTYPYREADLVVSFFTRDQGKLRGIARRARKPKNTFGSGLERLSLVNLAYAQKETRELVYLDSCDLLQSQFNLLSDFEAGVALDYLAEVSEQLLPPHEANEHFFRLLSTTLEHMHSSAQGRVWRALMYFSIWSTRLSGFLPDLGQVPKLSLEAREIASEMLRMKISDLPERSWSKETASDLRHFLVRQMEEHAERRFATVPVIEGL
jgi:DNA repair protein RecO (recombination protein O)